MASILQYKLHLFLIAEMPYVFMIVYQMKEENQRQGEREEGGRDDLLFHGGLERERERRLGTYFCDRFEYRLE